MAKKKLKKVVKKKAVQSPKKSAKKKPQSLSLQLVISPLADRLIVQIQSAEKITAGGLIIPDTAEISGNRPALVLAVGPGLRNKNGRLLPLDVKVGDQVLIAEYAGDQVEILGHKVQILRETDVLGIID
jgi:chaperonin GroES